MSHFIICSYSGTSFGNSEGARQYAIGAADAARLQRRADDAVFVLLDGIGRAHLSAGGIVAVPANVGRGCDGLLAVHKVEVDHRNAAMRVALFAGLQTALAPDAARGVDIEFHPEHYDRPPGADGLLDAARRHFVFGNLAARVQRPVRQPVRAPAAGPVVGNEDRVGPDGAHHHRLQRDRAPAGGHRDPIAAADFVLFRQTRMESPASVRDIDRPTPRCGASACRIDTGLPRGRW